MKIDKTYKYNDKSLKKQIFHIHIQAVYRHGSILSTSNYSNDHPKL